MAKADEFDLVDVDGSTFGSEPAESRIDDRQIRDWPGEHVDNRLDTVRAGVSHGHFGLPVAADALLLDGAGALRQNSFLHRPVHLRAKPSENPERDLLPALQELLPSRPRFHDRIHATHLRLEERALRYVRPAVSALFGTVFAPPQEFPI